MTEWTAHNRADRRTTLGKELRNECITDKASEWAAYRLPISSREMERYSHRSWGPSMSVLARTRERPVSRISISLPETLLSDLDLMVEQRGFESRSHAVNEMLHKFLLEHKHDVGDDVMVGIIALFYNNAVPGLQKQLADLQVRYIDEVISSLHVHLMGNKTMEVVLVQGPAPILRSITDEMTSRRGVISGRIHLVAALMPQVHPFIGKPMTRESVS